MKRQIQLAGASAALLMSMGANAQVIDLFTFPATGQVVSSIGAEEFSQVGPDTSLPIANRILGGYRDLVVQAVSGAVDVDGNGSCDVGDSCSTLTAFNGTLTFNNDTGVTGVGAVQWDGDDSNDVPSLDYTGLGGLDFIDQVGCPATGCDFISFEVIQADHDFDFSIGIYTDVDTFTKFTLISDGTPGVTNLPFSAFTNSLLCNTSNVAGGVRSIECGNGAGGGGGTEVVVLTNVGAAEAILNVTDPGTVAIDMQIGSVTKNGVPEPGTLALLGIGLIGAGFARGRKSKV